MPLHEGETILNGKYSILKLIGEGGMARTWLAEEPRFSNRRVAIKEPKREALTPEDLAEQERRFHQEVEVAAMLERARVPHVIRALTLEELPDGTPLLVMEYAEAGSLVERIAEHPDGMSVEQAVQITLDICQALQAFHNLPALPVHRDVKPSNILFDGQGRAYLADFGLCQLPGRSGRTQMQAGPHPATPLYAAPEQLQSPEPLTPAADLFALGCILFEMLTGERYKRHRPGTKPSQVRKEVPGWLDGVVAKALAEDPHNRWQSAAEMKTALEAGLAQEKPRRWQRWAGMLLVVLGLIAVALAVPPVRNQLWMLIGLNGPASTPGLAPTTTSTATPQASPSATPMAARTPAPTTISTEVGDQTPAPGGVPGQRGTASLTPTPTATARPSTSTPTETKTPMITVTLTRTRTPTPTMTATLTRTRTPVPTATATATRIRTPTPTVAATPACQVVTDPAQLTTFELAIAEYRLAEKQVLRSLAPADVEQLATVAHGEALAEIIMLIEELVEQGQYQELTVQLGHVGPANRCDSRVTVLVQEKDTRLTYQPAADGDRLVKREVFDGTIAYNLIYLDGRWKVERTRKIGSSGQ